MCELLSTGLRDGCGRALVGHAATNCIWVKLMPLCDDSFKMPSMRHGDHKNNLNEQGLCDESLLLAENSPVIRVRIKSLSHERVRELKSF